MTFNGVTIVSAKATDYRIHFWYMSKEDAISIINNSDLNFKKWIIIIFFLLKEYYENNKERLKEKVRNKYRELSNEEKNIKREYGRNRYQNMSREDKQRLKVYQKIIVKQKSQHKKVNFLLHIV